MTVYKKLLLIVFLLGVEVASAQNPADTGYLRQILSVLTSDSLSGRGAGTEGGTLTGRFLHGELQKTKGKSIFQDDFQSFSLYSILWTGLHNKMIFGNAEGVLFEDFLPFQRATNATVKAPICFLGYGIESYFHNDYVGIDLRGKWALLFSDKPAYISQNAHLRTKIDAAVKYGAAGVLITTPASSPFYVKKTAEDQGQYLDFNRFVADYRAAGIPVFQISNPMTNRILGIDTQTFAELSTLLANKDTVIHFCIQDSLEAQSDVDLKRLNMKNLGVVLEGNDENLKKDYIVIAAHYDHLGEALQEGKRIIYYGADDNASGVAAVLEIARMMSRKAENKRSILFLFFDGEECGLLGSEYFLNHLPTEIPIESIKAMVNLDMVGRYNGQLQVLMSQSSKQGSRIAKKVAKASRITIAIPENKENISNSDHYSFYKNNIPVFFLHTGLHIDYHQPTDTAEKINIDGLGRITDFAFQLVLHLANEKTTPTFRKLLEK